MYRKKPCTVPACCLRLTSPLQARRAGWGYSAKVDITDNYDDSYQHLYHRDLGKHDGNFALRGVHLQHHVIHYAPEEQGLWCSRRIEAQVFLEGP